MKPADKIAHYPWFTAVVVTLILLAEVGCNHSDPAPPYQGYAEGEYIYLSSPIGGTLQDLAVHRGTMVIAGAAVATLEHELEQTGLAEAEAALRQAESRLADLGKGARPSEITFLTARLAEARETLGQAERELTRRERLYTERTIAFETLDQARTLRRRAAAEAEAIAAQIETARLGGREDAIAAATAEVSAVKERVAQARWRLNQKSLSARMAGTIDDTFYEVGEFVPAGSPVASLLPPGNIKVRFFVPEPLIGRLKLGQSVTIHYDGTEKPLPATVTFIATRAEYTPPVIYSRTTRDKLVFMVEARPRPEDAAGLHPGQPVDVSPATGHD